MSSDNEDDCTNYGIDDEFTKSFGQSNYECENEVDNIEHIVEDKYDDGVECMPKFDKNVNKSIKEQLFGEADVEESDSNDQNLDNLMQLIQDDDDNLETKEAKSQPVKEPTAKKPIVDAAAAAAKQIAKQDEGAFIEKFSGIRVIKSKFSSNMELNTKIASECGKYIQLRDINRRMDQIKAEKNYDWFTVGVIGSKSESKCSAKGNNYIIWQLYDLNNLDRQQEVSLYLFGNAYKSYWKSSEFEAFAILRAEFFGDTQQSSNNSQTSQNSKANEKKYAKNGKVKEETKKVSITIRNDIQIVPLGIAKDISICQSYKTNAKGQPTDSKTRCKNLVDLNVTKFCIYHCKQVSKGFSMNSGNKQRKNSVKKSADEVNKYFNSEIRSSPGMMNRSVGSIEKPFNINPKSHSSIIITPLSNKKDKKLIKEMKEERILSLNGKPDESDIFNNLSFKSQKASDRELLAKLSNEVLNDDQIKKFRNEKTIKEDSEQTHKEMSKLFDSKILLATAANTGAGSKRLLELKSTVTSNPLETVNKKYQEEKKNCGLSSMTTHRDIMKELKKKVNSDVTVEENNVKENVKMQSQDVAKPVHVKKDGIKAFDFLRQHVSNISSSNKETKKVEVKKPVVTLKKPNFDDFELELYDGDQKTTQKLMNDVTPKSITKQSINESKPTSLSKSLEQIKKRKLEQTDSDKLNTSVEDERSKKLKLIDDIMGIKSNHSKEAEKAALNSYFNRLEARESADNRLSSMKNQQVKAVTCNICNYTTFKQSDLCKNKKHEVTYRTVLQRYFKCKNCNRKTFTLDKICPVSACAQCGSEKYEQCTMRDDKAEERYNNEKFVLANDSLL